jgi:divalent metal cation (Fe/Co/Zn/Cd) transporter
LKYLFAEISGSMALKAEAIHSLTDVIVKPFTSEDVERSLARIVENSA